MKKLFTGVLVFFIASITVFSITSTCYALIIDFENVPGGSPFLNSDIQSNGFNFSFQADHAHLLNESHLGFPSNGTNYLAVDDSNGDNPVTMSVYALNGQLFSLHQFDLAEFFSQPSTEIEITGFYSGGGTINSLITPDGFYDGIGGEDDFETFLFDVNWTGLSNVVFDSIAVQGTHQGWAIDNIVVDYVASIPEPSTFSLFLLAIGAFSLLSVFNKYRYKKV